MRRIISLVVLLALLAGSVPAYAVPADPLDEWSSRGPLEGDLAGLAYGNGQYVAVGKVGKVWSSGNGEDWSEQKGSGIIALPNDVAYGNDRFVAVGDDGIAVSGDGTSWVKDDSFSDLIGVGYGNGLFVAVGLFGTILTSSDGESWTSRDSGTSDFYEDIAYGNGQYVAVGAFGVVSTSPDGTDWTSRTSGTTEDLYGIAYGNGKYVASGWGGILLTSDDGADWSVQASGVADSLYSVAYGDEHYAAVGDFGTVLTSRDGVNWSVQKNGEVFWVIRSVVYAKGKYVAAGDFGTVYQSAYVGNDTFPPEVSFGTNGSEAWEKAVSTTVEVSDAGIGVESASLQYAWSTDQVLPAAGWETFASGQIIALNGVSGDWYLHVKAEDKLGNAATAKSERFRLDNTAPSLHVAMMTESGGDYANDTWTNQAVTVSVAASDAGTVTGVTYSLDSGAAWHPYGSAIRLDEEGVYALSLKAADAAGNETVETRTVKISRSGLMLTPAMALAGGGAYSSGEWTSENVIVRVNATAGASGIDTLAYTVNGGASQSYASGQPIVLDEEGVHALQFRVTDKAGNTLGALLTVKIDRTAPSVGFGTNGNEVWSRTAQTTVAVGDTGSGVNAASLQYAWSKDVASPVDGWSSFLNGDMLHPDGTDGDWHLHILAQDETGNVASVVSHRFRLDTSTAELGGLAVSEGELSPSFDPARLAYAVTVPHSVSAIVVTPSAMAATDTVTASVYGEAPQTVNSGMASEPLPLAVGDNDIRIGSKALNGEEKAYRLVVKRLEPYIPPVVPAGPKVVVGEGGEVRIIVDKASVATERHSDGTVIQEVKVTDRVMEQALSLLGDAARIVAEVNDAADAVRVQLPAELLADAADRRPELTVQVQLNGSSYRLSIAALQLEELAAKLGVSLKELTLSVVIELADEELEAEVREAAETAGHEMAGGVLHFRVIVEAGERRVEIDDFDGTYMARSIVPNEDYDSNQLLGVLYDPAAGTFHFIPSAHNRRSDGTGEVMMQVPHNSVYTLLKTGDVQFDDMRRHWARADVAMMASKLIVQGKTKSTFAPDETITRAEFTALLVRSLGLSVSGGGWASSAMTSFGDVASDAWYDSAIRAAAAAGLIQGVSEDRFAPDAPITREQLAVLTARAIAFVEQSAVGALAAQSSAAADPLDADDDSLRPFSDRHAISDWAVDAVAEAVSAGIMDGVDGGSRIAPMEQATRAQAAVMLKRLLLHLQFVSEEL
ncbi:S-layer homology domain-containing protein [Paenibacillus sp. J5C_2022]|uniref:S-layer homology domain-containing protein n=1 Tax=Paenibacillus sp. J5C2022 TaxID=2977129 RepID=UPI0021CF071F|nr:S-layer homology domain-containing protein [Paenibacillus sp. J5C2022]MCU6710551.1 S-layer homology domain-containing protein [Paenibacillus sp. J5C2022]